MSVVVRMEMPKEGCHTCDARCVSDLYGYICGIKRKNVMPFLGKKNRPDWCPILCQLPEGHGRLVDSEEDVSKYITIWDCNCSEFGRQTVMAVEDLQYLPPIVPAEAERSET